MIKEASSRSLLGQSFLIVVLWLGWVGLMNCCPDPFAAPLLRGSIRIAILLVPAFMFVRQSNMSWVDTWKLRRGWQRGVVTGLLVAVVFLTIFYFSEARDAELIWRLPNKADIWFNWIVGSPFAEEVWFRAILFDRIDKEHGLFYALVGSSLMFGLLHLPTWVILDGMSAALIAQSCGNIVAYSIIFALLFRVTGSIWAPLIPHWLNNLFLQGLVR